MRSDPVEPIVNRTLVSLAPLFVALASVSGTAIARESCQVAPFQGATSQQGAATTMQVAAGGHCSIVNYGVPAERSQPAESGKVTKPPVHGKAEFVAPMVTYTPKGGYVGADEFEYEAVARSATDRHVRLKVRVKVDVTAP